MSLIVQKFGGTSVANTERLKNVADIITKTYEKGNDVVVVVSAQGDTTDEFIEKARQVNPNPSKREMDMLLTAGEQISASLLAMTIEEMGYPVISLLGWQAGFFTSANNGSARIERVDPARIKRELDQKRIVIVTGFQGVNRYQDMTTLGRGGSDTTAVALAAWLKADRCQIFTDVDGVYDRDPRIYSDATRFGQISYAKMMTLIENGAQVLHDRSVELAREYGIPVEVLSAFTGEPGTIVGDLESSYPIGT